MTPSLCLGLSGCWLKAGRLGSSFLTPPLEGAAVEADSTLIFLDWSDWWSDVWPKENSRFLLTLFNRWSLEPPLLSLVVLGLVGFGTDETPLVSGDGVLPSEESLGFFKFSSGTEKA